ncbi:type VI secretion system tip protein VgrG [Hahella sp. KA22]|uniref:type VI secretion system Vgr family protein n=1 Tax=Hahella sp. KA22 TaxID=1628392 RepID=UPI000FDE2960|nr:type VI secretion system tip protein VgrG [Hahella sp. KA22]AZZ93442.1 type VI secretion system tip protein VgrG [Hahella sp. KA22]QAY56817.1 type VI secretion system tip protein VgrG [Hahella sp. KA22]
MAGPKQDKQLLTIKSPLGADVLVMKKLKVTECLSEPFETTATVWSTDYNIDPNAIVGKEVTISVHADPSKPRHFSGIVTQMSAHQIEENHYREYRLKMVPWFSLLKYRRDCRIFQELTVQKIIDKVFSELGFSDVSWRLQKTYENRVYCVQYRESDFDFVSRLLEEEGIYYYFQHEEGKHTLVLSDNAKGYESVSESSLDVTDGAHTKFKISSWEHAYQLVSGKVSLTDYNFETPATSLAVFQGTKVKLPNISKFEVYDYPGEYAQKGEGDGYAKTRMETLESGYSLVNAESNYPSMCSGYIFTVGVHPDSKESKEKYVVASVTHNAEEGSYRAGVESAPHYSNSFQCAPSTTIMRPTLKTPKPVISGTQTALVVGPSADEIYTDEFGRIKVQFYWDRLGKKDDKSSCWIRVAQIWSGKNWGAQYIPRIGQEVVISFLEGDPDRPLIIGSVYNAEQMPPYELPAKKTHTGVKSRSSKGGGTEDYNEIMLIDEKGEELIRVHAQKDRDITVENDDTESVGNNQSISVVKNQTEEVGENRTINIGKNDSLTVGENQSIDIGKNKDEVIGENSSLNVGKNVTVEIGKDRTESIKGKHTESITKEYSVDAKSVQITAKDEITLQVGKASITMKKNGDITINGNKINTKASGVITMKGSQIKEN